MNLGFGGNDGSKLNGDKLARLYLLSEAPRLYGFKVLKGSSELGGISWRVHR